MRMYYLQDESTEMVTPEENPITPHRLFKRAEAPPVS